jgi:hypothetical protein
MKEKFQVFKEFIKTPTGKTTVFFAFYFVLFLFVILSIRLGGHNITTADDYEKGNPQSLKVSSVSFKNFAFAYTIAVDQNRYEYYGQRNIDKMRFVYKEKNYYYDGEKYYRQDNEWVECENPFVYSEFLDPTNIVSLMEAASYESKTMYDSGKTNYNFLLSSNTINSLLKGINSDYFEEPNSVVVEVNDKREMNLITFHLNSYGVLNHICEHDFQITLEYGIFGEVKEIENPIG